MDPRVAFFVKRAGSGLVEVIGIGLVSLSVKRGLDTGVCLGTVRKFAVLAEIANFLRIACGIVIGLGDTVPLLGASRSAGGIDVDRLDEAAPLVIRLSDPTATVVVRIREAVKVAIQLGQFLPSTVVGRFDPRAAVLIARWSSVPAEVRIARGKAP
jgi:hypothetical protein